MWNRYCRPFNYSIRENKKKKITEWSIYSLCSSRPGIVLLLDILFVNWPKVTKRSSIVDIHVTITDLYEIQVTVIYSRAILIVVRSEGSVQRVTCRIDMDWIHVLDLAKRIDHN